MSGWLGLSIKVVFSKFFSREFPDKIVPYCSRAFPDKLDPFEYISSRSDLSKNFGSVAGSCLYPCVSDVFPDLVRSCDFYFAPTMVFLVAYLAAFLASVHFFLWCVGTNSFSSDMILLGSVYKVRGARAYSYYFHIFHLFSNLCISLCVCIYNYCQIYMCHF